MDASRDCFRMPFCAISGNRLRNFGRSRGVLLRNVSDYKRLLSQADQQGVAIWMAGATSPSGLTEFTALFPIMLPDQVTFMEETAQAGGVAEPHRDLGCNEEVQMQRLPKVSWPLLREAVLSGECFRVRKFRRLTGYQERQARTVLSGLLKTAGVLTSASAKGKIRLGFPVDIIERWLRVFTPVR